MLMHGLCRVVGQSEAVTSTDTTPKDLFDRTLYRVMGTNRPLSAASV